MSWIFIFMDPHIYEIFARSKTAQSLWKSLKDMNGHEDNFFWIFELQQEIAHTEQAPINHFRNSWERNGQNFVSIFPLLIPWTYTLKGKCKIGFINYWPAWGCLRQILMSRTLTSFINVCAIIQHEKTQPHVMNPNSKSGGETMKSSANTINFNPNHQIKFSN